MKYQGQSAREIAEIFWREGIVVVEGFYPLAQMRELAGKFAAIVEAEPNKAWGGGEEYARLRETRVKVWPVKEMPEAQAVMRDARLVAITRAICGEDCELPEHVSMFSTPRGGCQGWHQDSSSQERGQYELNRIVFPSAVMPEQGELFYVPGSHLGPDLPKGGNHEPLIGEMRAAPGAGALVLMHTRCFHRVGENFTDVARTQCNSRARPLGARATLTGRPVFRTGGWNFETGREE